MISWKGSSRESHQFPSRSRTRRFRLRCENQPTDQHLRHQLKLMGRSAPGNVCTRGRMPVDVPCNSLRPGRTDVLFRTGAPLAPVGFTQRDGDILPLLFHVDPIWPRAGCRIPTAVAGAFFLYDSFAVVVSLSAAAAPLLLMAAVRFRFLSVALPRRAGFLLDHRRVSRVAQVVGDVHLFVLVLVSEFLNAHSVDQSGCEAGTGAGLRDFCECDELAVRRGLLPSASPVWSSLPPALHWSGGARFPPRSSPVSRPRRLRSLLYARPCLSSPRAFPPRPTAPARARAARPRPAAPAYAAAAYAAPAYTPPAYAPPAYAPPAYAPPAYAPPARRPLPRPAVRPPAAPPAPGARPRRPPRARAPAPPPAAPARPDRPLPASAAHSSAPPAPAPAPAASCRRSDAPPAPAAPAAAPARARGANAPPAAPARARRGPTQSKPHDAATRRSSACRDFRRFTERFSCRGGLAGGAGAGAWPMHMPRDAEEKLGEGGGRRLA
ncbi:hypothetical protein CRUP_016086 [Coryphaenoides rupestris]|nr:hypothetical protein CRUP_016086 [Coryphaenoides rupestris]